MKTEEINTIPLLKSAERTAIKRALEAKDKKQFHEKAKWESRRRYISLLLKEFETLKNTGSSIPQIVFLSYSVKTGVIYYKHLEGLLKERGFDVITGFQKAGDDEGNVLKRVLRQIEKSTIFFGILTKEHKIQTNEGSKWSPGVWTVEEKGMALAMGKPFVLMVEKGVQDDFWKKTAPHRIHFRFDNENFHEKAKEAIEAVVDRYDECVIRAIGVIDS